MPVVAWNLNLCYTIFCAAIITVAFVTTLFNDLRQIDRSIVNLPDEDIIQLLLYGNDKYDSNKNSMILNASIQFILNSERFKGSLM